MYNNKEQQGEITMIIQLKRLVMLMAALFLLTACSQRETAQLPEQTTRDLSPKYLAGEVASKVDGWVVLLDASLSMSDLHGQYVKFDIARAFVENMNNTLPPISAVSGLRTFGHSPTVSTQQTELFFGMTAFSRDGVKSGIAKVDQPGGPTPLSTAINAAAADLAQVKGKKALIIVSDGEDLDDQPVEAAKAFLAKLGPDACIYTVHVGDNKDGRALMEKIAKTSACGFTVAALDILPANPMAGYVSDVFLTGKETGLGYHKAVAMMKPLSNIHFEFDSDQLTSASRTILDKNIQILSEHPEIKLTIEGHTSARGSDAYNLKLSERRAKTVFNYLTGNGNIPANRLKTIGFGENQPQVKESTPDQIDSPAAKTNMRVELKVIKQ